MRGASDRASPVTQYIDTTADVQMESARLAVSAGVTSLKVYFRGESLMVPVELTIRTSTGLHRGVHMSRLVHAANAKRGMAMEAWLRWICREVNRTQPNSEATVSYELPFDDQFAKVKVRTTERGVISYNYTVQGITACPCSKKMTGVGHMQRAEITLVTKSAKPLDSRGTVDKLKECFSAVPREELKRLDEAKKILEAQANPRFAEDLVRECVKRFPNALFVSARCFESIHAHDAIAVWSAKPGWIPSF